MINNKPSPPKLFLSFFRWYCHPKLVSHIEGDLMEVYNERLKSLGKRKADRKFIIDVLLLFRPGIIKPVEGYKNVNNYAMFKSYFKIGWRNLVKNKGYSLINIGGLATGMSVAIFIGMWVYDELSFNRNFKNYDRLAQVMQNQTFNGVIETWSSQAMQLAPELRNTYGGNFKHVIMSSWTWNHKLTYETRSVSKAGNYMEPEVTEMLTLTMIKGSRTGLKDPHSILLSESTATSIFGDTDPMNKVIRMDDKLDVKVTGIYEDLPYNSSYANLTFIAPWQLYVISENLEKRVHWGNSWFQSIVQIADHTDMAKVSANIRYAKMNKQDDDDRIKPEIFLHPMSRWHLYSDFKNGVPSGGRIQYVWLFGVVGVFVLLLACINFMNLSTARSEKRAKEVGIRKTIGSVRTQLINQFFSESLFVVTFAFILSLVLVQLALPWFNEVADKRIIIPWTNPWFWFLGIGFTFFTGVIAGSYPALYLSSFHPVRVLKGTFHAGRFASLPRKVLVVIQFTVSVTLIIGTSIVFRQIQFAQNRPIGYDNNGLISTYIKTDEIRKHYDAFREELHQTGVVEEVALTDDPITNTMVTNSGFTWEGKDPDMSEEFSTLRVTHEFGKTVDWEIVEGRDFSKEFASDSMAFIINESAAKYMNLDDPVGKTITWGNNGGYKIIGVIKDLVTQSPYSPVKQMLFFLHYERVYIANIKIHPGVSAGDALSEIETVFKKYDPANPFEFTFADQEYAKKFGNEKRIGKLASIFATLAIFISCLGLFGLASFVAEQRTKEIGIRKVMGASVMNLWKMLSGDFVILVVISCVIALPISVYFMSNWLKQYQYRTTLSWHVFAMAVLGALIITLLTVSYQAIRAALANPVKSLRSD